MNILTNSIESLGYDNWYQENVVNDEELNNQVTGHELARVISVHKESYLINKGKTDVFSELAGKLVYSSDSAIHLPTIGDWVYADFYDQESHAIIHDVLPRKTLIKRKTSGKNIDFQLIAANIDYAFIVQSLDQNFNLRRLERYLVMVNESNIQPIVLLSKSDLISENEVKQKIDTIIRIMPDIHVIAFSNENGINTDKIKKLLVSAKTYCLLGSSGVGKTTLLNTLVGNSHYETQPVREKDNKGRHTTTNRQLIQLKNGAMLIDTPGMRELGNMSVDAGIEETFSDIIELSTHCKFTNCTHFDEKYCAILSAINDGSLSEKRYNNYLNMKKETDYYDMSYYQKRQKDKQFGKLIKSIIKNKKEE
jgi:ribosome biogenesis GTPase / thiamine phosphate phosphatase